MAGRMINVLIEYGNTIARADWYLDESTSTGYSRVYYILNGELYYEDASGSFTLHPGKLYVLPSWGPYRVERNHTAEFSCTYMHISFDDARVTSLIEMDPEEDTCLQYYLKTVQSAITEEKHQLLEKLANAFSGFLQGHHSFVPSSEMQNAVQQYVREHISEEISIESMSHMLSYHPNYFIRLFKEETGYTPYQFLLQQRMQYAVVLLNKGMSNQETCEACGYTDSSTFTRAFRQYYGVTPQKYKNGFRRP